MALNHSQSQTRPSNFGQNGPCHDVVGVHIATSIPSNFPEHHNQLKHRKPVTFTPGHPYRPVHPIKYELGQSLKETFPAREIGCNIEGIAHMTGWPYPKPGPSMEIPPFSMLEPSNTKVACPDSLEMVSCPDFHYNNSPRYPPSDGSASTSLSSAIHNLSSDPLHIVPQHDWKVLNVSSPELPNQCPRQSTQAENVQGVYNSIPQTKISDDAIKTFNRLVSLLNTENSNNVGIFLSEVLKECHFVPLDEVFWIFYSNESPAMNDGLSYEMVKGIKLYSLVLEAFKTPRMFENNLLKASPVCIFNFHELSRNCLAMKILYECVKKVDDKSKILPRESFYKIYYILCQKLFERYPEISRSTCLPQSHILGQSKIGILTKLVHPDLVSKRIGKRGQSKASYIGLTLNYCVVDDEVKGLLHLDLPEIRAYFSKLNEPIQDPKRRRRSNREEVIKPKDLTGQFTSVPLLKPTKPLYSFVDLSCKYPGCDCSPRDWNISPNLVPKQSDWAQNRTNNSLQVLEGHGVNMNPLIDHISKGLFFVNEHSGISATIMHSINQLLDGSSSKETFLHFYIVVILVVFPAIIASDHEVSSSSKIRLRASVKDCVMKLEGKVENSSCVDKIGLKTFTGLLTKMIHINEMTSASIELCHSVGVLKEMAGDVSSLIGTVPGYSESSVFEQIFMNQFIKSLKAYEYELPDTSNSESKGLSLATIHNIGNCYMEASRMITREMQQIPICPDGGKLASDIPFQVFRISAKILHTVPLLSADVLQLPIRIITIIMTHHPHVLQNTSFERFSKCDPDLSKETFKSWWVYSSMFQEYMSVMSEVVALSQKLAQA